MTFSLDRDKWTRVRQMMEKHDLSAVVVRAPDNILYLTNYWTMKGYDIAIFPREGDPTLLVIEPQFREGQRTAWNKDVRYFNFYHPSDPRPPTARSLDMALEVLRERKLTERVGIELSQGSQICDRMVGEPTGYTQGYFDALRGACKQVVDAAPLLADVRMIKTAQEIERMRLANELAAIGMEYARGNIRPGMKESEVAAMIEGHIHAVGIGYKGKVEMARAFTLVWSGKGIATFTATGHRPVVENEPTLVEIWVCADGYWTDLTKNLCPGRLTPEYNRLLDQLLKIFREAADHARAGAPLGDIDRVIRAGIDAAGYPGQPSHPVAHGVGARAHEPPYSHKAAPGEIREGMVLAIEPGVYWEGGGGLRLEDNFLITAGGSEKLCSFPDDFRR
ncbi:MAG TPA: Xaa-Pro peptidase family protein [Candidatus Limnocylindrales bacterium]|nr:Xaa-Pro peptidase family protein [Candidatus Limnocylindrales bacterium]